MTQAAETEQAIVDEVHGLSALLYSLDGKPSSSRQTLNALVSIETLLQSLLGRVLYSVSRCRFWNDWTDASGSTFRSFEEFLDHDLKYTLRKAHYLIDTYRKSCGDVVIPITEPEKTHRVTFSLFDEQYENLKDALGEAAHMVQSEKTGHLLDMICTDFLAGRGLAREKSLISELEKLTGKKVELKEQA